ncbi:MAG: hypothetical protein ACREOG_23870, partial [Gemmatimonadaceae bacterium]
KWTSHVARISSLCSCAIRACSGHRLLGRVQVARSLPHRVSFRPPTELLQSLEIAPMRTSKIVLGRGLEQNHFVLDSGLIQAQLEIQTRVFSVFSDTILERRQ